jgi:hypothetical protein
MINLFLYFHFFLQSENMYKHAYICMYVNFDQHKIRVTQDLQEWNDCISQGTSVFLLLSYFYWVFLELNLKPLAFFSQKLIQQSLANYRFQASMALYLYPGFRAVIFGFIYLLFYICVPSKVGGFCTKRSTYAESISPVSIHLRYAFLREFSIFYV